MKVVILCGGFGTRIRDVADNIPKPMVPIGPYPILMHIMKHYARYGFKDFVLCLGYKGQSIKDFFRNYETHTTDFTIELGNEQAEIKYHAGLEEFTGWRVTLADTGYDVKTGSRVRKIKKYIDDDQTFMLTYGDGLGNINLKKLLTYHQSHKKIMTVTGVRPPGRFGELKADGHNFVSEFNEKPQASGGIISGGFFVCQREVLDYLGEGDDVILEREPINRLVLEKQVCLYEHVGFWQPMDTSREYLLLNSLYNQGEPPWLQ